MVDGEALIVMPGEEAVHHVLNAVGARIWEMLDGTHDTEAICKQLAGEFDVAPEEARRDLEEFLQALQDSGMLAGEPVQTRGGT
jgi:hypothetical protein